MFKITNFSVGLQDRTKLIFFTRTLINLQQISKYIQYIFKIKIITNSVVIRVVPLYIFVCFKLSFIASEIFKLLVFSGVLLYSKCASTILLVKISFLTSLPLVIKNDATTLLFHFFGTIMMQTTPSSPEEINITNGASVIGAEHFKITKV